MSARTSRTPRDAVEKAERYIAKHEATQMSRLHADSTKIAPLFAKVSKTPHEARANLCQGYGRAIKNTYLSIDAPSHFLNPEKVVQPANRLDDRVASVTKIDKRKDPLAASRVLPGGESMMDALSRKLPHNRHRSFMFEKMTIMDPIITARGEGPPIQWREVRKPVFNRVDGGETARSSSRR